MPMHMAVHGPPGAIYTFNGLLKAPSRFHQGRLPLPIHTPTMSTSPPASLRAPGTLALHPLLQYSQHDLLPGLCTALLWDLRDTPLTSARHIAAHHPLSAHELTQPATTPRVTTLHLTCGLLHLPLPPDSGEGEGAWAMEAHNPHGVTLLDVLHALHAGLQTPLTHEEWGALCVKQQTRVGAAFDLRWRAAGAPMETRARGVVRADCLLRHTLFAGLSVSLVEPDSCMLTVRRPAPPVPVLPPWQD
ncbi:hypothetical protein D9615_006082 [Tricholomella constricta]|uniref:DUF6699 domain-containing protein n=1 Tax=Tricholomella constricta TaxID=117010 RepID=A0A8H5H9H6_9AGAR|nr:hypothetical protein D9615_006082 [Tricholomella constricta]